MFSLPHCHQRKAEINTSIWGMNGYNHHIILFTVLRGNSYGTTPILSILSMIRLPHNNINLIMYVIDVALL